MTAQAGDTLIPDAAARKAALRQQMRRLRSAIPSSARNVAARASARRFLRYYPQPCNIAVYLSARSELPTQPLLRLLFAAGHRVYVPLTLSAGRMRFVRIHAHSKTRPGLFRLPQPIAPRRVIAVDRLDRVVVPLLAFDSRGARLGNGGGYYDRAFAGQRRGHRAKLIGYGYAVQEVLDVAAEPWDLRLDVVITDRAHRIPRLPARLDE